MKIRNIGFILLFIFVQVLNAQQLSQMKVVGKAELLKSELVGKDVRDANGEVCAGLVIESDLVGLSYNSYNGIVKTNRKPGKDFLFLSPDERLVEVYKIGYMPLSIVLNNYGVKLESGKVWKIKVSSDTDEELVPITIVCSPSNANLFLDNKVKLANSVINTTPGDHVIVLQRDGYKILKDTINVTEGNNLFTYELKRIKKDQDTESRQLLSKLESSLNLGSVVGKVFELKSGKELDNVSISLIPSPLSEQELDSQSRQYPSTRKSGNTKKQSTMLDNIGSSEVTTAVDGGFDFLYKQAGRYKIRAESRGYLSDSSYIFVRKSDTSKVELNLIKNSGSLLGRVFNKETNEPLPNVTISTIPKSINDISGEDGRYQLFDIKSGIYKVKAVNQAKFSYTHEPFEVEITPEDTISQNLYLIPNFGSVRGRITNSENGDPMPNVLVKSAPPSTNVLTDNNGYFELSRIPAIEYDIRVFKPGYIGGSSRITVNKDETTTINFTIKTDTNMVFVRGGEFNSQDSQNVIIDDFYIDKYEVTVSEYEEFCDATDREMPPEPPWGWEDDEPIVNVSFQDAKDYANWMGKRLPSKDEWEYAASGGKTNNNLIYSGSNDIEEVAWYLNNSEGKPHPVGTKQPNSLGIYDMSGNVMEWCSDVYIKNNSMQTKNSWRIIKGGSFSGKPKNSTIMNSIRTAPLQTYLVVGIRLVQDAVIKGE